MMKTIEFTRITFPEIHLPTRSAHHLRGYFGNFFQEHSPLLHNHFDDGKLRYSYPLVQYKIPDGLPTLIGIGEGAPLLVSLFTQIRELDIEGRVFPIYHKNVLFEKVEIGFTPSALQTYRFYTPWFALSQDSWREYLKEDDEQRSHHLNRILTGNILSFFKGVGLYLELSERILLTAQTEDREANFENKRVKVFDGQFTTNVLLPNLIGLGKAVSRGFGTITRM